MLNLDYQAATAARAIIQQATPVAGTKKKRSKLENVILKSLGILQEQGMYAASLYLWTRGAAEQEFATIARQELFHLSRRLLAITPERAASGNAAAYLQFVSEHLNRDLGTMLWMKDAWELALIYARFGAKTIPLPEAR